MYTRHFGLTAEPFSLTPDPDFLYLSAGHAEALAALKVGLLGRRGLMVMTGEVGTGKTTLLYALLRALGEGIRTAYVSNTALGFDGLLRLALADFGVTPSSDGRVDMLTALNRLLRDCAEQGVTATLVVDEAQNLDAEAFEQLRLLSNFETFTHKLLQIVLVGQPELEGRLRQPALRALVERVATHCRLAPLGERESHAYLDHRLLRAGGSTRLFERGARDLLLAAAQGLPRRINILCHNALLFAYGRGDARVTLPVAQLAVAERSALLQGGAPSEPARLIVAAPPRRVPRAAVALGGTVLVAAIAVAGLSAPRRLSGPGDADEPLPLEAPASAALPLRETTDLLVNEASTGSARTDEGPSPQASDELPSQQGSDEVPSQQLSSARLEPVEGPSLDLSTDSKAEVASVAEPAPDDDGSASAPPVPAAAAAPAAGARADNAPAPAEEHAPARAEEPAPAPAEDPAAHQDDAPRFRTVRVERGSTLESLTREIYGGVDAALIRRIQSANPQVIDPNLIMAGDLLHFPEVEAGRPAAQKGELQ